MRLADQRCQPPAQFGRRGVIEAVVDLACIDQILALAAPDIQAVPFAALEREPSDGQGLALGAGPFHPGIARARIVAAVSYLRDDSFETDRTGVLVHLGAIDLEALAELDVAAGDQLLQMRLALD